MSTLQSSKGPNAAGRVIGASCGAFVLGFISIFISATQLPAADGKTHALFWGSSLACGAVGGYWFPRFGHFLAYVFLFFMNVTLSLTIGRNVREQVLLFAIFAFVEGIFLLSKAVMKQRDTSKTLARSHDKNICSDRRERTHEDDSRFLN